MRAVQELEAMTDAELDVIAATEVMGWVLEHHEKYRQVYRNAAGKIEHVWGSGDWAPTQDRNQSRKVVEALFPQPMTPATRWKMFETLQSAMCDFSLVLGSEWLSATPRMEVIAAIRAARLVSRWE